MEISCPHCQQPIEDDGSYAGRAVNCPHCRGEFRMPAPKAVMVAEQESALPDFSQGFSVSRANRTFAGRRSGASHVHYSGPPKSPGTAAVLSFLLLGLGQVYNGEFAKAALFWLLSLAVGIIGGCAALVIAGPLGWLVCMMFVSCLWLVSVVDAYSSAERFNRRCR